MTISDSNGIVTEGGFDLPFNKDYCIRCVSNSCPSGCVHVFGYIGLPILLMCTHACFHSRVPARLLLLVVPYH